MHAPGGHVRAHPGLVQVGAGVAARGPRGGASAGMNLQMTWCCIQRPCMNSGQKTTSPFFRVQVELRRLTEMGEEGEAPPREHEQPQRLLSVR
jgi:hypothetical protein